MIIGIDERDDQDDVMYVPKLSTKKNRETSLDVERRWNTLWKKCHFVLLTIGRMLKITIGITPLVLTLPLVLFSSRFLRYWWELVRIYMEECGGAWVKLGQWASTRPDLFPDEIIAQMSQLCHHCPPHSIMHTRRTIETSFRQNIDDIFSYFPSECTASGAIAQVYDARLKDGTRVAVKVLHPYIDEKIKIDLYLMRFGVWFMELIPGLKWLGMKAGIDQFSSTMETQTDLSIEGQNLNDFNRNFKDDPHISFPKTVKGMVTPSVLVETFEEGESIRKFMDKPTDANKRLARYGLEGYFKMMLIHNCVHADLHPGNILVQQDGDNYKLVLLDVGLVTRATDEEWERFKVLFKCIVTGHGKEGAELMVRYAKDTNISEEEIEDFKTEMDSIFNTVLNSHLSQIQVGPFISKILSCTRKHKVLLEGSWATLLVGTVVLEGIGKQLDPDLDVLKASLPILMRSNVGKDLQGEVKEALKTNFKEKFFNNIRKVIPWI